MTRQPILKLLFFCTMLLAECRTGPWHDATQQRDRRKGRELARWTDGNARGA